MTTSGRALILMYHRIADAVADPWSLCVNASRFASHLEILRHRNWHAMSLGDMCGALEAGALPDRAVVVTFDDGYADNLWQATPLLEHYEIPATVFLVTGHLDGPPSTFWWDHLERLMLHPGRLPRVLRVRILDRTYEWDLGECAEYSARDTERYREWRAWLEPPTPRHRAYRTLWEILQSLAPDFRRDVLAELGRLGDSAPSQAPPLLTAEEMRTLADNDCISIGAHTVNHPTLAALTSAAQREEIDHCRRVLRTLISAPVETFAYPFGADCNFTGDTVALVREAGFRAACATTPRPVEVDADRYRLPRFQVENWTGEAFERRLTAWLGETSPDPRLA